MIHIICGMDFLMVLHEEGLSSSSPLGGRLPEESILLRNPTSMCVGRLSSFEGIHVTSSCALQMVLAQVWVLPVTSEQVK